MKTAFMDGRKYVVNVSEQAYKDLQHDILEAPESDRLSYTYNVYGEIYAGGLCMDLLLMENEEEDADFCIDPDNKWVLDSNFFLLGQDTGYGDRDGIPYSYGTKDGRFVGTIIQVDLSKCYDDAMQDILLKLNDEINKAPKEIRDFAAKKRLTWEKIELAT